MIKRIWGQLKELKMLIPTIYLSLRDRNTSIWAKIFGGTTIMYALSPIDLIPDFIPVLGYLDDIIILPILIKLTLSFISEETLNYYKEQSLDLWKDGKPVRWYYAIPFICIWILLILLVLKLIFFDN